MQKYLGGTDLLWQQTAFPETNRSINAETGESADLYCDEILRSKFLVKSTVTNLRTTWKAL
jgi:hypothetical protein